MQECTCVHTLFLVAKLFNDFYIMYIMKIKNLSEIKYIFNVYVNLSATFSTWRQQNFQSFKKTQLYC